MRSDEYIFIQIVYSHIIIYNILEPATKLLLPPLEEFLNRIFCGSNCGGRKIGDHCSIICGHLCGQSCLNSTQKLFVFGEKVKCF